MAAGTSVTPTTDSKGSRFVSVLFGILIILAAVYGVFAGGLAIYHRLSPPPTVALVADLEPAKPGYALHVEGSVQRSGHPLNGQAQITVSVLWAGSPQSVIVPIDNGKFSLRQNPQLTFERKDVKLLVSAEAWTRELPNRPAREEIYLNTTFPFRYKRVLNGLLTSIVVLLAAVFFLTFTGQRSPLKNRVAIVFSYCVMLLFLAIPLTVTNIALSMFTDQFEKMNRAPVGIVLAKPADAKPDAHAEWLLNIGGHLVNDKPAPSPSVQPERPNGVPVAAVSTTPSNAPSTSQGPESATPPAASNKAQDTDEAAPPGTGVPEDLRLEGGIAVPFYVLVLAVIGGAINMARKIPAYHQEGERSAIEVEPFSMMKGMMSRAENVAQTTEPQQQSNVEPGSTDVAGQRQSGNKPNAAAGTKEDWRTGLLHQYMYLISSPFLAIVTYYLMAWLGVSTLPALVLVSFSVGLISEPLMARITGAAEKIIGGEEPQPKAGEEKDQESKEDSPADAGEDAKKKAVGAGEP